MKPTGYLVAADLVGCDHRRFSDAVDLVERMRNVLDEAGFTHVAESSHRFEPTGDTILFVLSESHLALHTFPECGHVSVDVFHCSTDVDRSLRVISEIGRHLAPRAMHGRIIGRGESGTSADSFVCLRQRHGGLGAVLRGCDLLYSRTTPFQNIAILQQHEHGRQLFLDGDLQISERDHAIYSSAILPRAILASRPWGRVAVLGNGDGGVLNALLAYRTRTIDVVEIDGDVIELARTWLPAICGRAFDDPRVRIVLEEATGYLATATNLDLIVSDLTATPLGWENAADGVRVLIDRSRAALRPDGTFLCHLGASTDREELSRAAAMASERFERAEIVEAHVPSFDQPWLFLIAHCRVSATVDGDPHMRGEATYGRSRSSTAGA